MTTRAHLSIGEVLSLLQDEFPDITISKIRFLESQGLLDPERTPSGYRKFYDKDIERLRWILVQQRENFLPLKVIKDRLVSGDLDEPTLDFTGTVDDPPPGLDGVGSDGDGEVDIVEIDLSDKAPTVSTTTVRAGEGEATDGDLSPAPAGTKSEPPKSESPVSERPKSATKDSAPRPRSRRRRETSTTSGTSAVTSSPRPARSTASADAAASAPSSAASLGASVLDAGESGISLSLDELLAATGLTSRQVGELERYGLIAGTTLGSAVSYDEDALVIARLSQAFMAHGVEPRHIRSYKVAAEREVSVFEQLVVPVLKQRDPAARQAALESLRELTGLGEQIRGALLRQALRDYLGSP